MCFSSSKTNDLLVAFADRSIRIIKSDSGVTVAKLRSHRACVTCLAPHPMEKYAVSCGADHTMLWDLENLRRMRNIGGTMGARAANVQATFSQSGNTLITLSKSEGITLYHFPTLDVRAKLQPDPAEHISLRCFAVTANRMHLVAATSGKSAYIWHLPSETMVEEMPLPAAVTIPGGVQAMLPYSATTLPEGNELCMLGEDGVVRVLHIPSGTVTAEAGSSCYNFAVHMDRVVTATNDGALHLMDLTHIRANRGGNHAQNKSSKSQKKRIVVPLRSAESERNKRELDEANTRDSMSHEVVEPLTRPSVGARDQRPRTQASPSRRAFVDTNHGAHGLKKLRSKSADNRRWIGRASREGLSVTSDDHDKASHAVYVGDVRWQQRTERLRAYLETHGSFSEQHRANVWAHLLNLPRNEVACGALLSLGDMPLAADQLENFAASDSRLKQRTARIVHALAHWCEALACSSFLPSFVHPWVRFFGRDQNSALEACITFILNWASSWFEYWPAPPLHVLAVAERLAFLHDPVLVKHLVNIGASSKDYAWPLIQSMFSEVCIHPSVPCLCHHPCRNIYEFGIFAFIFACVQRIFVVDLRLRNKYSHVLVRVLLCIVLRMCA
jgi:WD40 repeat protein